MFVAILVYMGIKIAHMDDFFRSQAAYFSTTLFTSKGIFLILPICLVAFNWLFEALKWREALKSSTNISLKQSLKSVLTGQAINLIIPANIGHIVGRLANIDESKKQKIQLTSLFFVCQVSQMLVTFFAFLIGLIYLKNQVSFFNFEWTIIFLSSLAVVLSGLFFYYKFRKNSLIVEFSQGLRLLKTRQGLNIFLYSALRYLTFNTQFVLVFYFLGVEESWLVLSMGISLVFMAKSLMPNFNLLSDIGIREFSALLFLPLLGLPEPAIIAASLWIWLINIFTPSLLGAFLILKSKLGFLF